VIYEQNKIYWTDLYLLGNKLSATCKVLNGNNIKRKLEELNTTSDAVFV
jgi:hypothetical protein